MEVDLSTQLCEVRLRAYLTYVLINPGGQNRVGQGKRQRTCRNKAILSTRLCQMRPADYLRLTLL